MKKKRKCVPPLEERETEVSGLQVFGPLTSQEIKELKKAHINLPPNTGKEKIFLVIFKNQKFTLSLGE